ncbi:MAG: DUF2497 domain-containing protein [Pseudomonadota bacterium]
MTNAHKYSSRSSMDDILSSIRRIIDESVSTETEAPVGAAPADAMDKPVEPVRPPELLTSTPVTPRAAPTVNGVNGVNGHAPLPDENAPHDRRFTPDDAEAFREVAEVLQSTANILQTQDKEPLETGAEPASDRVEEMPEVIDEAANPPAVQKQAAPPPVDVAPVAAQSKTPKPMAQSIEESARDQIVPLVSSATSRSIAQTLAALDEVLKERTGEDLKATTEEMLKPMLAEWLDENLPSMVERLVRQEIERIARGEPRAA